MAERTFVIQSLEATARMRFEGARTERIKFPKLEPAPRASQRSTGESEGDGYPDLVTTPEDWEACRLIQSGMSETAAAKQLNIGIIRLRYALQRTQDWMHLGKPLPPDITRVILPAPPWHEAPIRNVANTNNVDHADDAGAAITPALAAQRKADAINCIKRLLEEKQDEEQRSAQQPKRRRKSHRPG